MGASSGRAVPIALAVMVGLVCVVGLASTAVAVLLVIGYGGGTEAAAVVFGAVAVLVVTWWVLAVLRARSARRVPSSG